MMQALCFLSALSGTYSGSARAQNISRCSLQKESHPSDPPISRRVFSTISSAVIAGVLISSATPQKAISCCTTEESKESSNMIKKYVQKSFAKCMNEGMVEYEKNLTDRKKALFALIPNESVIVDIGIGTGPNLKYYPSDSNVIGIEPNTFMWTYTEANKKKVNSNIDLKLMEGGSEQLPLDSASCDVAVMTLTLCSVKNVEATLSEINRVLKPNGLFIFVEHVIAPKSRPLLRFSQQFFTPLQVVLCDGCHLNRDSGFLIESTLGDKCKEIKIERFDASMGSEAENASSLIKTHISGYTRKI